MPKIYTTKITDAEEDILNIDDGSLEANLSKQSSFSGDAVLTTNYEDDYTVRGNKFHRSEIVTTTQAENFFFLLDMSSVPSENSIFVLPFIIQSKEADVEVYIYRDTDYTSIDATEIQFYNCNENISDDYDFVITSGTSANYSGTNKGTTIRHHIAFASSQGFYTGSGSGGSSDPIILDTSKNYLVEFVVSGATRIEYDADLFQL